MQRISITPRNNWKKAVEQIGFGFHSTNVPYWDESACYQFTMDEILSIEKATAELWTMCLNAVQFVIDEKKYADFHIPVDFVDLIEKSWNEDAPSIYGRFDFAYKNGEIKLLEFNADTPTSIYEAGVVQWYWLQDFDKSKDQFNSIHEKLVGYWGVLKDYLMGEKLHFTCVKQSLEDLTTTEYLRDCAIQAGIETKLIFIEDIGYIDHMLAFVDMEEDEIHNIFKLYPWEWLIQDQFGKNLLDIGSHVPQWIEPAWKMILSNKAILPILWFLYPGHPLLLKSYFDQGDLVSYAKKPLLSREGACIELVKDGVKIQKSNGNGIGCMYQDLFELPDFNGNYPVIGSWVIGQEPAGMGIRESKSKITDNKSRFIPHLIV